MSTEQRPRLAVLDMDGTTVEDHGLVHRAFEQVVESLGARVVPRDLQELMGTRTRWAIEELARRGGIALSSAQTEERVASFRATLEQLCHRQPPEGLPGVDRAIDRLRAAGIRVALTTGFPADIAGPLVELLGWEHRLDAVVCSSDVPAGVPSPAMILRAMELTGVRDARRVLVAGDTVEDIRAGVNAGAGRVYGVLTGAEDRATLGGHGESGIIQGVLDLPDILGV